MFFLLEYLAYLSVLTVFCLAVPATRGFAGEVFQAGSPLSPAVRLGAPVFYLLLPLLLAYLDWLLVRPDTHEEKAVETARKVEAIRELTEAWQAALAAGDQAKAQKSEEALRRACAAHSITSEELSALLQKPPQEERTPPAWALAAIFALVLLAGSALTVLILTGIAR